MLVSPWISTCCSAASTSRMARPSSGGYGVETGIFERSSVAVFPSSQVWSQSRRKRCTARLGRGLGVNKVCSLD